MCSRVFVTNQLNFVGIATNGTQREDDDDVIGQCAVRASVSLGRSSARRRRTRLGATVLNWPNWLTVRDWVLRVETRHSTQTWNINKKLEMKLRLAECSQRAVEGKKMMGVTLRDKKRAVWIRNVTRVDVIIT